jgi:hypothetical protein
MNELLKPTVPEYTIKIPSTGQPIKVRPFLVGEERLLLMALESGDADTIIDTTKQIIKKCIIDEDVKVDVDKLPFFDVDYLFIALRAKSVGEDINITYTCNADHEGEHCGATFPATIDISNVTIEKIDMPDLVEIPGNIKIKLKYPSYSQVKAIYEDDINLTKKIKLIVASIEYVLNGEKMVTLKDVTEADLTVFVENLTQESFEKLEYWVDNFPSFLVESTATCEKCGNSYDLRYTDFDRFFD